MLSSQICEYCGVVKKKTFVYGDYNSLSTSFNIKNKNISLYAIIVTDSSEVIFTYEFVIGLIAGK